MDTTHRGTVKWFNDAKGFGFINHPTGKDVFVHYSSISSEGFRTLLEGELVEYELTEGPKGLHAAKVYRLTVNNTANITANAANSSPTTNSETDQKSSPLRSAIQIEKVSRTDESNSSSTTTIVDQFGEVTPVDTNPTNNLSDN